MSDRYKRLFSFDQWHCINFRSKGAAILFRLLSVKECGAVCIYFVHLHEYRGEVISSLQSVCNECNCMSVILFTNTIPEKLVNRFRLSTCIYYCLSCQIKFKAGDLIVTVSESGRLWLLHLSVLPTVKAYTSITTGQILMKLGGSVGSWGQLIV